jgi:uncharacterized protein
VFAHTQFEVATWNQIYDMLLNQAEKIYSEGYKPDLIVGISRGGIVPARILSDLIETPNIEIIQIEFYSGIAKTTSEPILKHPLRGLVSGKKTLLVDDVSDSGKSLKLAKNHLQQQGAAEIKTATLYTKPQSITKPDFAEKQTSRWIVFPWDVKETVREISQSQKGKRAGAREIAELVRAGLPKQLAEKFLQDMQGGL